MIHTLDQSPLALGKHDAAAAQEEEEEEEESSGPESSEWSGGEGGGEDEEGDSDNEVHKATRGVQRVTASPAVTPPAAAQGGTSTSPGGSKKPVAATRGGRGDKGPGVPVLNAAAEQEGGAEGRMENVLRTRRTATERGAPTSYHGLTLGDCYRKKALPLFTLKHVTDGADVAVWYSAKGENKEGWYRGKVTGMCKTATPRYKVGHALQQIFLHLAPCACSHLLLESAVLTLKPSARINRVRCKS